MMSNNWFNYDEFNKAIGWATNGWYRKRPEKISLRKRGPGSRTK